MRTYKPQLRSIVAMKVSLLTLLAGLLATTASRADDIVPFNAKSPKVKVVAVVQKRQENGQVPTEVEAALLEGMSRAFQRGISRAFADATVGRMLTTAKDVKTPTRLGLLGKAF